MIWTPTSIDLEIYLVIVGDRALLELTAPGGICSVPDRGVLPRIHATASAHWLP